MIRLLFILTLLGCFSANAVDRITASLVVTNGTTNGQTITINGNVRTWTNSVFVPLTQILTNSTAVGSKTNLHNHLGLSGVTSVTPIDAGPTNLNLIGACGVNLTVTLSAGWGSVTYTTNQCTNMVAVRVPITGEPTGGQQTNIASLLVSGINSKSTNSFFENSITVSNLVGRTNAQSISGQKAWTGSNYFSAFYGSSPFFTNGVNYGSAFASPGSGSGSEQFGNGALASGDASTAIGKSTEASAEDASALGNGAIASAEDAIALGAGSIASGSASIALGGAIVTGSSSFAAGIASEAANDSAFVIGVGASSTRDSQIMLGNGTQETVINGPLTVLGLQTNSSHIGTNYYNAGSDISFGRFAITSLANGNNAGVLVGTNVFVQVSGPSGAFTINGINGSPNRNGKYIIILNRTGQNMTIANDSGTDPTAGNRIYTLSGGDEATTGDGAATLIYSSADSRWILLNLKQ